MIGGCVTLIVAALLLFVILADALLGTAPC